MARLLPLRLLPWKQLLFVVVYVSFVGRASAEAGGNLPGSVPNDLFFSVVHPDAPHADFVFHGDQEDINLWNDEQRSTETRGEEESTTVTRSGVANNAEQEEFNLEGIAVHSDSDSDSDGERRRPHPVIPQVECARCTSRLPCIAGLKCWGYRCVPPSNRERCRRSPPTPECHSCRHDGQCAFGLRCWLGKCVRKEWHLQYRCFKNIPDCAPCHENWQCANRRCYKSGSWIGRCARSWSHHRWCNLRDECADCSHRSQCKSRYCHYKNGKKKCVNPVRVGSHHKPHPASEAKCFPPPKVGHCRKCGSTHNCLPGLVCHRANPHAPQGLCSKLMGPGQGCRDPCWVCGHNLQCKHNRCVRGHCQGCHHNSHCENGSVCVRGKCSKVMGPGQSCKDPCWICGHKLQCKNDRCVRGHCEGCHHNSHCENGSVCVRGKCSKVMGPGQSCKDPCWICGPNLQCKNDRCVRGHCQACSNNSHCENGSVCLNGKCSKVMGPGQSCKEPCWKCGPGLQCKNNKCVRGHCEACHAHSHCDHGFICKSGKCTKLVPFFGVCNNDCLTCTQSTICENHKCVGGQCHPCLQSSHCYSDLVCKHLKPHALIGKCAKQGGENQPCNDPCSTCKKGLFCQDGKTCVWKRGNCCKCRNNDECKDGLVCQRRYPHDPWGKCTKFVSTKDEHCDPNSCTVCKPKLECRSNLCRPPPVAECEACRSNGDCVKGLFCRFSGKSDHKGNLGVCTARRKEGQACKPGCVVCEDGLECRDNKCEKPRVGKCKRCRTDDNCVKGQGLFCLFSGKTDQHGKIGTCTVRKQLNENCSESCAKCKDGLECRDGLKCKPPRVDQCKDCREDDDCEKGKNLFCKFTNRKDEHGKIGQCTVRKKLGDDCSKGCAECEKNTFCRNGRTCTPPRKDKCGECREDDDCMPGKRLFCKILRKDSKGPIGECTERKTTGQECSAKCEQCEAGLFCRNGRKCTPPRVDECGDCREDDDCMHNKNLYCKFTGRQDTHGKLGKCTRVIKQTEKCEGVKGCKECEKGTTCRKGKCRGPPRDKCGDCRDNDDCKQGRGLYCKHEGIKDSFGNVGKCFRHGTDGDACGDECSECREGTECRRGICRGKRSEMCGQCRDNEDCPKEEGVICHREGWRRLGRCVKRHKKWEECDDDCWLCKKDLVCRPSKDGGKFCAPPGIKCDYCSSRKDCMQGLVCKYWNGVGKCAEPMGVGHECSDHCWACHKGLRCACKDKKCEKKYCQKW